MAAHVSPPDISALREKIKKEVGDYLDLRVTELRANGVAKVSFAVAEGDGPEEIIDLARRSSESIVAMSTHGRSGIGRWVLGSVTDRVVSYSGGPVLAIRPVPRSKKGSHARKAEPLE
jgi:nucleotide-binding universal stress UspA family protein